MLIWMSKLANSVTILLGVGLTFIGLFQIIICRSTGKMPSRDDGNDLKGTTGLSHHDPAAEDCRATDVTFSIKNRATELICTDFPYTA